VYTLVRKIDFDLLLVLSIPFILLAANNEWLFPYGNPSDGWINKNYFYDTGNDFEPLYTYYKATRLSWIVKGYLLHQLFSPLVAHYVLHLTLYCAYLAAFYLTIRYLMNRHVAVITTIVFGTYSQFHAVISFEWDYQTHDGVTNQLLTLLFMLIATRSAKWRLWLVLAGAAWASALQTTYLGIFIPAVVFWYLYLNRLHGRNPVLASGLYILFGAVAVTLLYCLASYLLGGPFFFFMALINPLLAFGFEGGFAYHIGYWQPFEYILQHSKGLVMPLYATIISACFLVVILVKGQKGPSMDSILAALIPLLVAFAMSVALHLMGHGQLSNDHIIAYMSPFVFLAIAGQVAYFLRVSGITVPARSAMAVSLKLAVLIMACGALIYSQDVRPATEDLTGFIQKAIGISPEFRSWQSVSGFSLLLFFSAIAIGAGLVFRRFGQAPAYISVLCVSGLLALINIQTASIAVASYDSRFKCGFLKDQYEAVVEAYQKIRKFDPEYDLRLWYRNNEFAKHPDDGCANVNLANIYGKPEINMTELYGAIWGMRSFSVLTVPGRPPQYEYLGLVDRYLSTRSFEEFSKRRPSQLPLFFKAAILSKDPQDHLTAIRTLGSHGLKAFVIDHSRIHHGAISFDLTILEVRKDDRLKAQSRN